MGLQPTKILRILVKFSDFWPKSQISENVKNEKSSFQKIIFLKKSGLLAVSKNMARNIKVVCMSRTVNPKDVAGVVVMSRAVLK